MAEALIPENIEPEFSHIAPIGNLPRDGKSFSLLPDAEERAKIARRLKLPSVRALRGDISMSPIRAGVEITGSLCAVLERVCVATLSPMEERLEETFAIEFIADFHERDEASFDPDGPSIEPLETDHLDLGEILVQQVALLMAPHPRKAQAASLADQHGIAPESSPFDALKGMVRSPDGEN